MSTLRYAWLALIAALVAGCGPSAVCTSDEDCADFGAGSTCVRGDRAEGLCSEDGAPPLHDGGSPDDAGSADDGGEPPTDSGPTAVSVSVSVSPESVSASENVTLSWTSSPTSVSCEATAQSAHESSATPVPDAPTAASGNAVVPVEQDTTFTVSCTDVDGEIGVDTKTVDVATSGTLTASSPTVDVGTAVELTWTTYGASACALHDASGEVHSIPTSELPSGSHALSATSARYELHCDGSEVASVDLALGSVSGLLASPSALGRDDEPVELTWTYTGPDAASCTVEVNEDPSQPVANAADGHQVTLSETADIVVSCDGYSGALTASVTVPRLIESFVGPGTPLEHGVQGELAWTAAPTASCAVEGDEESPAAVTPLSTTTYTLVCSEGDKTASATVEVQVLPRQPILSGEIVPVDDENDGVVDRGELVLSAVTSPNALACEVNVNGEEPGVTLGTATLIGSDQVFSGSPPTGLSGSVELSARCFSDEARTLMHSSVDVVTVYFGDVTSTTPIADISQVSLVMGNVNISGDATVTSVAQLGSVRQVSGSVWLLNLDNTMFTNLDGLHIERVIGDVEVRGNDRLERVGSQDSVDLLDLGGLAWLEEVHGSVVIVDNIRLDDIVLTSLTGIGRELTLSSNDDLKLVSAPALVSVGEAFTVADSVLLDEGASELEGFDALTSVGGRFTVDGTALDSVESYFPNLLDVLGDAFVVTFNSSLDCADIAILYCDLSTTPAVNVSNNLGGCGLTAPIDCP